jgi:hypothetical protein
VMAPDELGKLFQACKVTAGGITVSNNGD